MRVLFVEDDGYDVWGVRDQCDVRGWETKRAKTFREALDFLKAGEVYNAVVLDIMLPWGDVPDKVTQVYSDKEAGLRLLESMRGTGNGAQILHDIEEEPLDVRHAKTPVIVLTKIAGVEAACNALGALAFFSKGHYQFQVFMTVLENLCPQGDKPAQ
jgi:CheY-like chemotaxis protein